MEYFVKQELYEFNLCILKTDLNNEYLVSF